MEAEMAREKILVVEDDPDVLNLCKQILISQGYQVEGAGDGYEAIERAKGRSFDLVLADIKMPGMNGMEAYRSIKEFNPDIVGVIITGYASIETAIEAVKLGFDGFVTKPFTPDELHAAVMKALERSRLDRENARLRALIPLFELSEVFMATIDLGELLDQVVHTAQQETKADRVSLMLLDEASGELTIEAVVGLHPGVVAEAREKAGEGIAGWVAKRGEPLLLDDEVPLDPKIREAMKSDEVSSALCVPLKVEEDRVIGVLNLSKLGGTPFAQMDLELVSILCGQAAIAIENARLHGEEERRATQLALINEVGGKVASILDLDRLMQEVACSIQEKFGYYNVALFFLDEECHDVVMQAVAGGFEHVFPGEYRQALDEGIIGFVIRTGNSWLANDVSKDPHYVKGFPEEVLTKSELCVPIKLGDKVIAALDVQSIRLNDFDQADVAAMEAVADRIAIAIQNARLYEEIKERMEETSALYQVSKSLVAALDLDALLKQILEAIRDFFGYSNGAILLLDESGTELYVRAASGFIGNAEGARIRVGQEGITGWVAQHGEMLYVPDVTVDSRYMEPVKPEESIRSEVALPLKVGARLIGVLNVESMELEGFDERHLRALSAIADQAAIAIENARLFQESQRRAEEMTALREVSLATLSTLERDQVLEIMLDRLGTVIDYDTAAIKVITSDGKDKMIAGRGSIIYDQAMWDGFDEKDSRLVQEMKETRQPVVAHDTHTDERYAGVGNWEVYRSWVGAPLFVKSDMIGYLAVEKEPADFYDENAVQLLGDFARVAAMALENARLFEETERLKVFNESIVQGVAEAILIEDAQGILTFANPAVEELLGYPREELIGLHWSALMPEDEMEKARQELAKRPHGIAGHYETALLSKERQVIPVIVSARPLFEDGEFVGVLAAFTDITERKQAEEELRQSYVRLRKTLEGTIHVLVSAIERRDPYTAGHQRRVAQLACAIAKEMGLSAERIEGTRMAAVIHDIGKVNVPAEILSKPGSLNHIEFGLIKMHPQVGHDILDGAIDFPWPVAEMVLQHHERMDGSGYPQGLSGEEILLEARILAVADVVEAMSSHRPYRPALSIDEALDEISRNRDVLYDPEVVDACLKLFSEKGFTFE
jgi:PAS domain S-box-containing protein